MPPLKSVPAGDSWCDQVASEVCSLDLHARGIPASLFLVSVQPSHGAGLAMMQHGLPTPCHRWSLLNPETFLLTILVRIWPHHSCSREAKKLGAKRILVPVISAPGLSEMTSLFSLNVSDFSLKGLVPLPSLICVFVVGHLRSLEKY